MSDIPPENNGTSPENMESSENGNERLGNCVSLRLCGIGAVFRNVFAMATGDSPESLSSSCISGTRNEGTIELVFHGSSAVLQVEDARVISWKKNGKEALFRTRTREGVIAGININFPQYTHPSRLVWRLAAPQVRDHSVDLISENNENGEVSIDGLLGASGYRDLVFPHRCSRLEGPISSTTDLDKDIDRLHYDTPNLTIKDTGRGIMYTIRKYGLPDAVLRNFWNIKVKHCLGLTNEHGTTVILDCARIKSEIRLRKNEEWECCEELSCSLLK